jgi:8-oxo-dGTP diphosphatase
VVTFVIDGGENEMMFLFTCSDFTGELRDCDEGTLEWIPKSRIYDLELWEGDRIFLKKIEEPSDFFTLKLVYDRDGGLTEAVLNGTDHLIDRRR